MDERLYGIMAWIYLGLAGCGGLLLLLGRLRWRPHGPILLVGALLAWVSVLLLPNFVRPRLRPALRACQANLRNLSTALEMYAADNDGRYPRELDRLVGPSYLKTLPTCPRASNPYRYEHTEREFTVFCAGPNHPGLGPDFPRITSRTGLLQR